MFACVRVCVCVCVCVCKRRNFGVLQYVYGNTHAWLYALTREHEHDANVKVKQKNGASMSVYKKNTICVNSMFACMHIKEQKIPEHTCVLNRSLAHEKHKGKRINS